ncbi:TPA: hypothetical protein N0F65_002166 [Lagenidium giganteum]|uniref:Uncharacterized protein n=1 Tax=Lagenidium giganteum TaxID=4803 RepID=A0AAV2YL89_9STRA|nr:TPA: hypothetical protein N0F65_002166 [Lagenidium giganteum]
MIIVVLVKEIIRATTHAAIIVPTTERSYYQLALHRLRGGTGTDDAAHRLDCGKSRFRMSTVWLADPSYLIGNAAYALGTSTESQMIFEIVFWQYNITKELGQLMYAGIYAARHAWVSIAIWTVIRALVTRPYLPLVPVVVKDHIRRIEMYCSSRMLVLTFLLASLVTATTRGTWFLTNRVNIVDVVGGIPKGTFWQSEVIQNLAVNHALALVFTYTVGLIKKAICDGFWPHHCANSFLQAVDRHRVTSGFDMVEFLAACKTHHDTRGQCMLVLRMSEFYQVFASVNLLWRTAVEVDADIVPEDILTVTTKNNGHTLCLSKSGSKLDSTRLVTEINKSRAGRESFGLVAIV